MSESNENEIEIKVGDRVRSFDFVIGEFGRDLTGERATYVEGIVEAIEPVEWCGAGCNHYAVRVEVDCLQGVRYEVVSESVLPCRVGSTVFPPTNENGVERIKSAGMIALHARLRAELRARREAKRIAARKDSE